MSLLHNDFCETDEPARVGWGERRGRRGGGGTVCNLR